MVLNFENNHQILPEKKLFESEKADLFFFIPGIKYNFGAIVIALIAARPKCSTGYLFFPHPSVPRKTHRPFNSFRDDV